MATGALAARVRRFALSVEDDAAARAGEEEDNLSFATADGGGLGEVEGESFNLIFFMFGDASLRGGGSSIVEVDMVTGGVSSQELFRYIDDELITSSTRQGVEGFARNSRLMGFVDGHEFIRRNMGFLPGGQIWRPTSLRLGNPGPLPPSGVVARHPTSALVDRVANLEARSLLYRWPSSSVELQGRWRNRAEQLGDNYSAVSWSREIRQRMRASAEIMYRLRMIGRYFAHPRDSSNPRMIHDGRFPDEDVEDQSEWEVVPVPIPYGAMARVVPSHIGPWRGSTVIYEAANPQEGA